MTIMGKIRNIIRQDFIRAMRDSILMYIIVSPLILAIVAAALLPSINTGDINGYVTPEVYEYIGTSLEELGEVRIVESREILESSVALPEKEYGLLLADGKYELLLDGREGVNFENSIQSRIVHPIIRGAVSDNQSTVEEEALNQIRIKGYVLVFLLMITMLLGGMTAGMLIVEERSQGTIAAASISPISIFDYMLAKSMLSSLIPLVVGILVSFITLGTSWSLGKYLVASLASYPMGILLGLLLGYFADSQIAALGVVKLMMPVFLTVPLISVFVPRNFAWLFFVFPNFWMFKTLESLYLGGLAQFRNILLPAGISLFTGVLLLFLLMPKVARRIGLT